VLNLSTNAIYRALAGLLPVLPRKAADGLRQLGVDVSNLTLDQLLATPPAPGHKLGMGEPLFPRIEK
jgi:methionyl-tRNA synthetase